MTRPELPKTIDTDAMNDWALNNYGVPTFNELTNAQIDVFEAERSAEWQRYNAELQKYNAHLLDKISTPMQATKPTAEPINHRQAMVNEWIANGNSSTTIKQKLAYLDELDAKKKQQADKVQAIENVRALKRELVDITDKYMHPNTTRTERAGLLKRRFEVMAQLQQ